MTDSDVSLPQMEPTLARQDARQDPEDHAARMADLDAWIARMRLLPSLPEIARLLAGLREDLTAMTVRMEALERECHDLRQRDLLRFWETDGESA